MRMSYLQYSFIFFMLVPHVLLGRCDDISYSICWMSTEDALEKQSGNIWLNDTSLKSIRREGFVTSLTVSAGVANKLTLQYGGSVWQWTIAFTPSTEGTTVTGHRRPLQQPTNATNALLDLLNPAEVFACENGTIFFYQDKNFFLAVGHTLRLPVKLESRSPTMLLVSWLQNHPDVSHTVTLYQIELGSYNTLSMDTTTHNHYRFSALDSCSSYVACVQIADTQSFTCLSTITDPDIPKDFEVTLWNTSSISLSWESPINQKYSLFLLSIFYLNGTDHIIEEVAHWQDNFVFTLSDLQPCSRVKFGLQTVCREGIDSRYSKMIFNDGNSVLSSITALHQIAIGPDNYTLSWQVRNISSISMFRVYHKGELQGTTLHTNYTVQGLLPCHKYKAKVEALCGDGVLMGAKTVTAHTGPRGVSELRYNSNGSTVLWTPSIPQQPAIAFIYELSMEKGPIIQSSRLTTSELRLPGLDEGKTYILDIWEECDGEWESVPSRLRFEGSKSTSELHVRAAGNIQNQELQSDLEKTGLALIVPWSLPKGLQDMSEAQAKVGKIFKDKMQELLKDFTKPVHMELVTFEPHHEPDKTEILFRSFDATEIEHDVLLPVDDQLNYISSLNATHITVRDGVIHWEGPDLCVSSLCPRNSLCINTLGSFSCVCQHGYYDVSSVTAPLAASHPVCKEKGLFSQCLNEAMTGGIAKPYLMSHIGGKVDLKLNDGRCAVNESQLLYYFHTTRRQSECGTERQVNKSHIVFQNTLTVTLTKEQTISRRDLKLIWRCIYPRHYVRKAQVGVDLDWLSSASLVEFNSSLQLGLSMTLYVDESYTYSYKGTISLDLEDTLFFEVALQTNSSFASDVLLQVESCWATESTDPQDTVHGVLLQDRCPIDNTFHWLSVNGLSQRSRFSTQMFTMPKGLPLYFHCLANICGRDEDCTQNCSSLLRPKRSVGLKDKGGKRAAVVSAGPLIVHARLKPGQPSYWAEHMTMISIVAGSIGFLLLTVLLVSATKAIMTYFEQLRVQ